MHSRETAAARYGYPPPQHPPPHYGYGAPPGGVKLSGKELNPGMMYQWGPYEHIEALLIKSYLGVLGKILPAFLK